MDKTPYVTDPDDKTVIYISPESSVKRHIVCAANKFEMVEMQDDIIVCGARHHDPIMRIVLDKLKELHPTGCVHGEQGFIDQYQQFVTRKDARDIVIANKQQLRDGERLYDELFSENLY